MTPLLLALCLAAAVTDDDDALRLEPQVATWLELDTNSHRVPSGTVNDTPGKLLPPPETPVEVPIADGLVSAQGLLTAEARADGLVLRSDSALGAKAFFTQTSESMMVAQSRAIVTSSRLPGGLVLVMSAQAKGRAQLSGVRSYGLGRADILVEKALLPWLALRMGTDAQAFHAFDVAVFSSAGGNAVVGARALSGAESADVVFEVGARGFPFAPRDLEDLPGPDDPAYQGPLRTDGTAMAVLQLTSARRLYLSGSYVWMRNASNARGESWTRHRLSAVAGFHLPSQITCTAQATVQITAYDDGVSVGQSYFLGDDEDSQNVFNVTMSRPLLGPLFVEARASFMGNELAVGGARFSRQTVALGLRAAF